jgi:type IV pilus assembly protein PilF
MIRTVAAIVLTAFSLVACVTTAQNEPVDIAEASRANMDLGISYLRQGNFEQARVKFERSVEMESNNPTSHRLLGLVYERLGDLDAAGKQYNIAVRQAPDDPDALNQLGIFLCTHTEDKRKALDYFERAINAPRYQQRYLVYSNAGTCAKSFDLVIAETYLRKGLELNPNYAEALLQLGDVTYQQGNYFQSRAFVERYFSAADASSQALWLAYRVENALGDSTTAKGYAGQLMRDFPESPETRLLLEQQRNAG